MQRSRDTQSSKPAAAPARSASDGLTLVERDQIRRRARAIWREEGCPQGRDREHWERAELQVLKAHAAH